MWENHEEAKRECPMLKNMKLVKHFDSKLLDAENLNFQNKLL